MPPGEEPKPDEFPHHLVIPTRWQDNDVYGHVNNVQYYSFFDTIINDWLIRVGGLDIHNGEAIGVCAESHCQFLDRLERRPVDIPVGIREAMETIKAADA